jgi:hypothetical protein
MDQMSDERPIDAEQSPALKEVDTLVPYSRFREWQRRRAVAALVPPDQPPGSEAAIPPVPVATPTHER